MAKRPEASPVTNQQADPTQTTTLRRKFAGKMFKRFRRIKGLIRTSIVDNDALGLTNEAPDSEPTFQNPSAININEPAGQFQFATSDNKHQEFMEWLEANVDEEVLELPEQGQIETRWTDEFVEQAYKKGSLQAGARARGQGADVPEINISQYMKLPANQEAVETLYSRTFSQLRGVTQAMDQEISRVLSQGLAEGISASDMAEQINDRVDKIGITRAQMVARTEVINAHSTATLNRYERIGIQEVEQQAEFLTAGDFRVCFPKYSQVDTKNGKKSINKIKKGDKVKTRNGYKKVTDTFERDYKGDWITVFSKNGLTTSTEDHPYYTSEKGFLEGFRLNGSHTLQSSNDESINIFDVVNFGFSDSYNLPSFFSQIRILFSIMFLSIFMPIVPVSFKTNSFIWKDKIDSVIRKLFFLFKSNIKSFKRYTNFFFQTCFPFKFSITGKTTKTSVINSMRTNSKFFSTISTINGMFRPSTLFGAMPSIQSSSNVRTFNPKFITTIFTFLIVSLTVFHSTFFGTVSVSFGIGSFDTISFSTSRANLLYSTLLIIFLITITTTISSIRHRFWKFKFFSANRTFFLDSVFSCFRIAFMRTVSVVTLILLTFVMFFKFFSTIITFKSKWHYKQLLSNFVVLYHGLLNIKTKVYDIEVKGDHEFYCNEILVHNCPKCAGLEGQNFTISEARGILPVHPRCRCAWIPRIDESQEIPQEQILDTRRLAGENESTDHNHEFPTWYKENLPS